MRASSLLARCPDVSIPYNFLRYPEKVFLCEGLNGITLSDDLQQVIAKGQQIGSTLVQGLQKEKGKYEYELGILLQPYTALHIQELIQHDLAYISALVQRIGDRLRSRIHEALGLKETQGLLTLQALQHISFPQETRQRIRDVCIGLFGTAILLAMNTAILQALKMVMEPGAAFACAVILCAPFIEEFYKVVSTRITRSQLPAFITFNIELMIYAERIFSMSVGLLSPLSQAVAIVLGLFARVVALNFHMTTTQAYLDDIEKSGTVHKSTYLKGVTLHALFNMGGSLLVAYFNFISLIKSLLSIPFSPRVSQNMSQIVKKSVST